MTIAFAFAFSTALENSNVAQGIADIFIDLSAQCCCVHQADQAFLCGTRRHFEWCRCGLVRAPMQQSGPCSFTVCSPP